MHPPAHETLEAWHDEPRVCTRRKFRGRGYIILALAIAAWLVVAVIGGFLVGIASLLIASGADAHDAPKSVSQPLGWTYGIECCSLRDCAPIEPAEIGESAAGYVINRTGEVIAYNDHRIKRSRDEFYHRCTPAGNMDSPRSICLYVPDRGF